MLQNSSGKWCKRLHQLVRTAAIIIEMNMSRDTNLSSSAALEQAQPPNLADLARTWLRIGCTSFGGGSVVQRMIYDTFISKNRWISPEDYTRIFAMCELTPGITLFAICTLTGYRLKGLPGSAVSLLSFIIPSATVTILMTALYVNVREHPAVQAALKGIFAAVFGVGLAMDWRIGRPILATARKNGRFTFAAYLTILLARLILYAAFKPPVAVLYIGGALLGALTLWLTTRKPPITNPKS